MLTKVSSGESPGAGFNGAFYEVKRNKPSDESSQVTQGTRFEGGSFERFIQDGAFEIVKREFAQQAERLKEFAHENNPQNALHIVQQIDNFLRKFEDGSFSGYQEEIYGQGKGLFDRFCGQIADDNIPLDKRLAGLSNLAHRMDYCGFGIIADLQQAVFDLSLSDDGLHQQALDSHDKLVDAALQDFVANGKVKARNLGGMEIHYVLELKRRLGFPVATELPIDRHVSFTDSVVETAQKSVKTKSGPCQVALLTAETCLQSLRGILPTTFTLEQLQTAIEQLTKQFGPIPFNYVAQYDDDSKQYSLVASPNLLAKSFLESLTESRYCSNQIPDQILSWTTDDHASRTIFCQKDTIPYVEVAMGRASELYNVTNEDLTQLYREARSNPTHVKLPNEETLYALCLSAIEAAEPGQLAHFDFEWMRGNRNLFDLFLRKCPPDELRSWVNNRVTHKQRVELVGIYGNSSLDNSSKLLDAVGPEEAGRILAERDFEDIVNNALVTHNGPLLKAQFELLDKTDHAFRKSILLNTSPNFSRLVNHGKNVEVLEQYLSILQQARLDGVLNSADIVRIIGGKRNDGATNSNIAIALASGRAHTLKAVLDALPKLDLKSEEIFELVAAKNTTMAPGFYLACQNGSTEALKVYFDALIELGLSAEQIHDILGAKSDTGVPAIKLVCVNGKAQTLQVILDFLPKSMLSSDQLHDLLAANSSNGVYVSPALYQALAGGHTGAVQVFMQSLPSLGLTMKDKLNLLDAKRSDGVKAYTEARAHGYVYTVEVFKEALKLLGLNPFQRDRILSTGPSTGPSTGLSGRLV